MVLAGRLVDRDRRALAGRVAPVHRRLAAQLDPRAHLRLQRLRPADRQRDRLGRRRQHDRRPVGRDRAVPDVRLRDRRPGGVADPGRRSCSAWPGCGSPAAARGLAVRAGLVLWLGWLLVTGLTFSFMAGIFHPYYTVALAPAIGALVGIGALVLWRHRDSLRRAPASSASRPRSPRPSRSCCSAATRRGTRGCGTPSLVVGFVSAALLVGVRHLPRRFALAVAAAAWSPGSPARRRTPSRRPPPRTPARSRAPARRRPAGSVPAVVAGRDGSAARRRSRRGTAQGTHAGGTTGWRRRAAPAPAACSTAAPRARRSPPCSTTDAVVLHLGRRGDRLQQRGRLPARHRRSR